MALDAPVLAYAVSGREVAAASAPDLSSSSDKALSGLGVVVPFATKIHVVVGSETLASLSKRYNISLVGLNKLNNGRFNLQLAKTISRSREPHSASSAAQRTLVTPPLSPPRQPRVVCPRRRRVRAYSGGFF